MKIFNVLILSSLCTFSSVSLAKSIVVWDQLLTHPNSMVPELLNRALQVTSEQYGEFQIIPSEAMEQGRVIKQMENLDLVQIAIFAPDKDREKSAIPIRIPVTGSLLSYRICLIQNWHQKKFDNINDLNDLINSKLRIGQHQNWPDTTIMEANGLTIWKSSKYNLLFEQLAAGRFDCFSRGANEVVQEFKSYGYKGLEIEDNLIIYYPLPLYYFVNKRNPELALRIEKGLEILQKNGEYEAMFKAKFGETLKTLKMQNRKIITLDNPLLTDQTKAQMQRDQAGFTELIKKSSL